MWRRLRVSDPWSRRVMPSMPMLTNRGAGTMKPVTSSAHTFWCCEGEAGSSVVGWDSDSGEPGIEDRGLKRLGLLLA